MQSPLINVFECLHANPILQYYSEKDELELQLRAVPELERRVAELTAI
jgi:hypothetical protein